MEWTAGNKPVQEDVERVKVSIMSTFLVPSYCFHANSIIVRRDCPYVAGHSLFPIAMRSASLRCLTDDRILPYACCITEEGVQVTETAVRA